MLTSTPPEVHRSPLTQLSEEENLFQSTVRRFAREQIGPHVREMDEAGVFRKDIIKQFFELGLMGIEIPEEFGGQGGSFFQCVMAALSAYGQHQPGTVGSRIEAVTCQQPVAAAKATRLGLGTIISGEISS